MDRSITEGIRQDAGGIISLAKAVNQYRGAIEYDLLTRTGYELKDVGKSITWGALDNFLNHSEPDSALIRELNPELAKWSSVTKTNAILADIYDKLSMINANLIAIAEHKPARKPKPYPRPGEQPEDKDTRHFGKGALPVNELHEWIERKRAEYGRSSTGHDNGHPGP